MDLSQQLVQFERQRILNIITSLKAQLLVSLVSFLFFGGFLIPIVTHKIIRPLRVIERTTHRIAREISGNCRCSIRMMKHNAW